MIALTAIRRQQKLGQMLAKLSHMAEEFNVAVLLVDTLPQQLTV